MPNGQSEGWLHWVNPPQLAPDSLERRLFEVLFLFGALAIPEQSIMSHGSRADLPQDAVSDLVGQILAGVFEIRYEMRTGRITVDEAIVRLQEGWRRKGYVAGS